MSIHESARSGGGGGGDAALTTLDQKWLLTLRTKHTIKYFFGYNYSTFLTTYEDVGNFLKRGFYYTSIYALRLIVCIVFIMQRDQDFEAAGPPECDTSH